MKVEINEQYNFKKITPETGYVLSDWDKQDILKYSSSTLMYTPMSFNENTLYEITVAEDAEYKEQQRKAYEEEEKKRREA